MWFDHWDNRKRDGSSGTPGGVEPNSRWGGGGGGGGGSRSRGGEWVCVPGVVCCVLRYSRYRPIVSFGVFVF